MIVSSHHHFQPVISYLRMSAVRGEGGIEAVCTVWKRLPHPWQTAWDASTLTHLQVGNSGGRQGQGRLQDHGGGPSHSRTPLAIFLKRAWCRTARARTSTGYSTVAGQKPMAPTRPTMLEKKGMQIARKPTMTTYRDLKTIRKTHLLKCLGRWRLCRTVRSTNLKRG